MIKTKSRSKFFHRCFLVIICLEIISCNKEDVYLYDKTGFVPQKQYVPAANYPRQGYAPSYPPSSRAYRNPYDAPPNNYYPYYDLDQYYVPPTYYNNYRSNSESEPRFDPNLKY